VGGALAGEERVVAFILMIVDLGREYDIASQVRARFPGEAKEVYVTYGEYDIVVKVEVSSLRELDRVVTGIRSIPGVKTTATLISSYPEG
jgi:DNA-binding Lrp family transcriptional regulator